MEYFYSIYFKINFLKVNFRHFPGSPVIKTSPSNAGVAGLIPGWGTNPTCFRAKKSKHKPEAKL